MNILDIKSWWLKAKYTGLKDEELVSLIKKSDQVAFSVLYERYKLDAFNYSLSILKDKARATDATHDSFLKFYEKRKSYDEQGKFKSYFFRIIRNRCFDILKKKSEVLVDDDFDLEVSDREDSVFDEVVSKMTLEKLDNVFYELEDLDRDIFSLWLKGFSMKDISEVVGQKESFVKTKIFRIKKKFVELGKEDEKKN